MLEIKRVNSRQTRRDFVNIVDKIYKNSEYYVPTIKLDDHEMFNEKKNIHLKDAIWYPIVVYRDKKPVGRVIGIIQNLAEKKTGVRTARFYYFDCFEDFEACEFMMNEIFRWAKQNGAVSIHGPLGFNDTDREGMVVEGFDTMGTYVSLYNYPYYVDFMEKLGFTKDVDWLQHRVSLPDRDAEIIGKIDRLSDLVQKRYKLHFGTSKNNKEFIKKYGMPVFEVLNKAYAPLYETVPIDNITAERIISGFKLLITTELCCIVLDENEKPIAFAICFANISKAVAKSKGRLLPFGIFRLMRAIKHYDVIDLALIAVIPEYQSKGINAMLMSYISKAYYRHNVKYMETNLNLEENIQVQSLWKDIDSKVYRRNRSWKRSL
ncbi:GNAT family N-acetyltransferase [Acholeplasma sp. OttesenSCG-928-E16]|nr:GNAT family N-acetyltransferase [Acholeplasma sp. OttesenSCG-928-E16]